MAYLNKYLIILLISSSITSAHAAIYKDLAKQNTCPPQCYSHTPFNVDYACVEACLDYEHTLTQCQNSCTN